MGGPQVEPVEVYAKAEWFNPSGSVKDRAALSIIRAAEADGRLTHDKTILDATSGNMGIAYAMLGAALGYRVKLVMPLNVSPERKHILRAYGAEMVFTDPMLGGNGAIRKAQELNAVSRAITSTPTSTTTKPTGARITRQRRRKSGARPRGASRTS